MMAMLLLLVSSYKILTPLTPPPSPALTPPSCYPKTGLRPLKERNLMGSLLEEYGFTTGVEVGVAKGTFAKIILSQWKSCQSYKLVDLWKHQENYLDGANVNQKTQDRYFAETKATLKAYSNITEYYQMYSTEAAQKIPLMSLDFAYIDARHDYCGVRQDLEAYWPLLKPGGIMAGHDYVSAEEVQGKGEDWSICQDGTKHEGAVRGAVEEFFLAKGLTITVTYLRGVSWLVQKPMC